LKQHRVDPDFSPELSTDGAFVVAGGCFVVLLIFSDPPMYLL
jgi:hypothetical protein